MKITALSVLIPLTFTLGACSINVSEGNDFNCSAFCEDEGEDCLQRCQSFNRQRDNDWDEEEHPVLFPDADEDGDGYTNAEEEAAGSDPCDPDSIPEEALDPDADDDEDGLSNGEEEELGTDPQDPDCDDDGLSDGEEQELGTDPHQSDTDEDGYDDADEGPRGTDPLNPDSDGDGYDDGEEVACNSSPIDPHLTCDDTLCSESE